MKKTLTLVLGILVAFTAIGQVRKTEVKKIGNVWHIITTEPITDTTAIPDPTVVTTPPIVVDPPTGTVINVVQGQSVKQAVEKPYAAGTTINITGTFSEPSISVPVGVSLQGTATINYTTAGSEGAGTKQPLFSFSSGSRTNGNQSISGLILQGNNIGYNAISITNRDNVTINGVTIRDFNFNGAWVSNSTAPKVINSKFHNTGWADARYLSGALNIYNVTGMVIQSNEFTSDKNSKGTGIEALWKYPDNPNVLSNLKILNNRFKLSHHNPWNNGSSKNFAIEFHNTDYRGIEIAYNNFGNEISMASHRPGNGLKTQIHHNTGNLGGDTYFIETVADDFEIFDNVMENSAMFLANFQANSTWKNWVVRNNTLKNPAGAVSWGATILVGAKGVLNVRVENNKFPTDRPLIKYMGTTGGITTVGVNQLTVQ